MERGEALMGTTIRPELSEKNPYWIEKHRYYELKHFCLQYPIWRKAYSVLDGYSNPPKDLASFVVTSTLGDPTAKCAMAKTYYSERTDMVERVAGIVIATIVLTLGIYELHTQKRRRR